ncbi:putative RNA polymerase sigma factor FecI [compost metagenome]
MPERYYRELLRYFTRKAGDGETAADVVQEAYTRMLTMQDKGAVVFEPRALLYETGRNVLANQIRRHAVELRMLNTIALVLDDSAPCVERQASARQQLERFVEFLDSLPRKRRNAFLLVRIYGFSYAEAAKHMEISEIAIERHMTRALLDCAGYEDA